MFISRNVDSIPFAKRACYAVNNSLSAQFQFAASTSNQKKKKNLAQFLYFRVLLHIKRTPKISLENEIPQVGYSRIKHKF